MSAPTKPNSPRAWARLILSSGDAERKALLDRCPTEWRDMVLDLVSTEEAFQRQRIAAQEKLRPQAKPAATPVTASYRTPAQPHGTPAVAARHLAAARAALGQGAV